MVLIGGRRVDEGVERRITKNKRRMKELSGRRNNWKEEEEMEMCVEG